VVDRDQQRPHVRRIPLGGRQCGGHRFVGAQGAQHVRPGGQGVRGHDEGRQTGRLRLRHQKQTTLPTARRGRPVLLLIGSAQNDLLAQSFRFHVVNLTLSNKTCVRLKLTVKLFNLIYMIRESLETTIIKYPA
jgi:hypothetical protein